MKQIATRFDRLTSLSRLWLVAAAASVVMLAVFAYGASPSDTARADHNEFPNEQFCENVLNFFGAEYPEDLHGAFHMTDFENYDELGPTCFMPTNQFGPYLVPGGTLLGGGDEVKAVVTPNGNMNFTCRISVPPELIAQPITSTLIVEDGICFGPLGPTDKTLIKLNPAGIAQLTCHFKYGE